LADSTAQFLACETPISTALHVPYLVSATLHTITLAMKKRLSYNARVFPCPYKCNAYCHSASRLTQHRAACPRNPANCRATNPTIQPPQTPPATTSPPATPLAASPTPQTPDHSQPNSRPHTPTALVSPLRHQWTTNARGVRTWVHPYLNGSIFLRDIPSHY
jgi:hypothetical protein